MIQRYNTKNPPTSHLSPFLIGLWTVLPGPESLLGLVSSCSLITDVTVFRSLPHLNLWSKALTLLVTSPTVCPSSENIESFWFWHSTEQNCVVSGFLCYSKVEDTSMIIFSLLLLAGKIFTIQTHKNSPKKKKKLGLIFKYWLILLQTFSYHLF